MKRFLQVIIAVFMAALMGTLLPVQVFADTPDYISEVKIGMGRWNSSDDKKSDVALKSLEGYTILKDDSGNPIDLNRDAEGGIGSKGEKVVYLGYKTTKNPSEAITDLALMNMKGGYSVKDYETLMENQMKAQIVPLVDRFLAVINEYRENYKAGVQRAVYINGILNKFIDDDAGKGLGDLLLNETVYEMAKPQFDALSDKDKEETSLYDINLQVRDKLTEDEKNDHADILTIIAQSNGRATLMMENLLTRAADTNDTTWLERFTELDYDKLVDSTKLAPTDADKQLAKLYDDSANLILDMWNDFQTQLLNYDEYQAFVKSYDDKKLKETEKKANALEEIAEATTEEEATQALTDYADALSEHNELLRALKAILIHDSLEETEYGDGTLLDFFMQSYEDIADDITVLYPLVAALSKGQKAGLEFVSLEELVMIALSEEDAYSDTALDDLKETSIYSGVDRSIYEKDAVALTSDAIRADFAQQTEEENNLLSDWTIAMWAVTGVMAAGAITSASLMIGFKAYSNWFARTEQKIISTSTTTREVSSRLDELYKGRSKWMKIYDTPSKTWYDKQVFYDELYNMRASYMKWMTVGFTVAMVIIAGVSLYLTYRDLQEHYNVAFTTIPRYMVDEKDLTGYNKKGEKITLKNQSAYYKAVECNRTESDEFYKVLGTRADMNGDVGQQWLALYAVKNEAMDPILASSLKAVVDNTQIPAGYKTGIHMFGTDAAFNLNSIYDWNNDAPSVFVYFKTDTEAVSPASTAGSNFTAGNLALSGVAGLGLGAALSAIVMGLNKKKKGKTNAA